MALCIHVYLYLCAVHICEVPLQDILCKIGLADNKHKVSSEDSKKGITADILKDIARTAASATDDNVDKKSYDAKKTSLTIDKAVADDGDKTKRAVSKEQIRRRRKQLHNVVSSEKIIFSASPGAGTPSTVSRLVGKPGVVMSQPENKLTLKDRVSSHECRQRRSRPNVEVTKVTPASTKSPPAGDGRLRCRNDARYLTAAAGVDASYGSEAVEDVIQRLLDNDDELMDSVDQSLMPGSCHGSGGTVDGIDSRRGREVSRKASKSPWIVLGKPPRSAKLLTSLDMTEKLLNSNELMGDDDADRPLVTSPCVTTGSGPPATQGTGRPAKSPRFARYCLCYLLGYILFSYKSL